MFLTSHGLSCVKIQSDSAVILIDPYAGKDGLRAGQQADIVLMGNGDEKVVADLVKGEPMVVIGPGEYETKGVFVYGIPEVDDGGVSVGRTFFVVKAEGVSIGCLGAMRQTKLTDAQLAIIEGVDVLLVPVGGGDALNAKQAADVVQQIEPRLVVPMYTQDAAHKNLATAEPFLKAEGAKQIERGDKLKVSAKHLPQEETHYFVFSA